MPDLPASVIQAIHYIVIVILVIIVSAELVLLSAESLRARWRHFSGVDRQPIESVNH